MRQLSASLRLACLGCSVLLTLTCLAGPPTGMLSGGYRYAATADVQTAL